MLKLFGVVERAGTNLAVPVQATLNSHRLRGLRTPAVADGHVNFFVVGKFAPGLFLHFDAEFFRGAGDPFPRLVALGICNVLHLIEPGDGVPHMRGVD